MVYKACLLAKNCSTPRWPLALGTCTNGVEGWDPSGLSPLAANQGGIATFGRDLGSERLYKQYNDNSKISLLYEKAETFFSHTESTFCVRHSSEYEALDNGRKVSRNIYQMRLDSRDRRILCLIGRKVWPMGAYSLIA